MTYSKLKVAIKSRKAVVAIVGLGYVGLPTALALTRAGFRVVGIDINKNRVKQINAGKSFNTEIPDAEIKTALKRFKATTSWEEIKKANIVIIAVPTPLTKNKIPDTSAMEAATKNIGRFMKEGTLVVLESTTYPGTTEELLKPILEKSGTKAGKDFYLAFAPERIDPGNKQYSYALGDIPKVVGGINQKSTDIAAAFYLTFIKRVHKVSSTKTAEMSKLLENIFRLVNISLVNELKAISDKMGIDFWEVIEAAKTKPYGFMPFYPGPGVGGHCIPLDPFYLSWKAKEYNFFTRFIDLAGEINELAPNNVVTKVTWLLNREKKPVRGSRILTLGVAYKKDIDDPRESPALSVIWNLLRKGANVIYNDPYIATVSVSRDQYNPYKSQNEQILKSAPLTKKLIKSADCVLILTDHTNYDYKMILKEAKFIIDTRNAIKQKSLKVIK